MAELIHLENIHKIYNEGLETEVRAIDGISATIGRGEFVAILGTSGSGKSTLMNILGCLDVPTYGKYYLDGTEVSTFTDKELSHIRNKQIGFIFQGFNLIKTLTSLENVELPLIYRGIHRGKRREMAISALKSVGLSDRMYHRPNEMSGGQQQRVAVARAIAAQPPIIMADEPTGNLDSVTGKEVMGILTDLYEKGHTIILITHDSNVASFAKRTLTISDGKLIGDFCGAEVNT